MDDPIPIARGRPLS